MNGILLLIYSGFTINLVLQCALGIKGIAESKTPFNISAFIKLCLIFFITIFVWFLFSQVLYSMIAGIFIYVLLFPVSIIIYDSAEYLIFRYIIKKEPDSGGIISFPGGLTAAASFICVNIANNFFEAFLMSFGFTSSLFFINVIIREIRARAALESVPVFLRGKPLVLVTIGLLSLVLSTASILIFKMIGAG